MSYSDWFSRDDYFSRGGEHEQRFYIHAMKPDKLDTPERVAYYDRSTAQTIAELQAAIDALKEYRQALAARYAYLETAPYTRRLELIREPRYGGTISYHVQLIRTYEDGTETTEQHTHFEGKQRRDAIKLFESLAHQNPGITTVKDIARKSWEK